MPRRQMHAEEAVGQCVRLTGCTRELAQLAIVLFPGENTREYREDIADAYTKGVKCGFIWATLVLPVLISIVSSLVARWLIEVFDRPKAMAEAYDMLLASHCKWADILTSINTNQRIPRRQCGASCATRKKGGCTYLPPTD